MYEPLIKELKGVVKLVEKEVKLEKSFLFSSKCAFKEDLKEKILNRSYKLDAAKKVINSLEKDVKKV